jgi:hypothetical protein
MNLIPITRFGGILFLVAMAMDHSTVLGAVLIGTVSMFLVIGEP